MKRHSRSSLPLKELCVCDRGVRSYLYVCVCGRRSEWLGRECAAVCATQERKCLPGGGGVWARVNIWLPAIFFFKFRRNCCKLNSRLKHFLINVTEPYSPVLQYFKETKRRTENTLCPNELTIESMGWAAADGWGQMNESLLGDREIVSDNIIGSGLCPPAEEWLIESVSHSQGSWMWIIP